MTDQRRAEADLRESVERFRTLAEAVPQMVWVTDPAGRVVQVNRRWTEYTGIPSEEAYAHGWEVVARTGTALRIGLRIGPSGRST